MKIKSPALALITLVIFFGGIALTSALNLWQTESAKIPVKYNTGEASGEYNPADIRGSYSFGDVHELFDIPLQDLKIAFRVPDEYDIASFQNKQLEEIYESLGDEGIEIGNSSVQLFVAFYKNLPFDLTTDIYLLSDAVQLLEEKASLTEEQRQYLSAHQVDLSSVEQEVQQPSEIEQSDDKPVQNTSAPADEEHDESEYLVRGKTTFQEVIDWGVPVETIESYTGTDIPNPQVVIRDYCTENGIEFSVLKNDLQLEVDQIIQSQ